MATQQAEVRQLKEGRYLVVGDEPCKILNISTSKPGKHGSAKARLEVMGLFDGQKRSVVHSVTDKIRIPIIDKRSAQVVSLHGDVVQLMDLETYQTFEITAPADLSGSLEAGKEVQYMEAMGRRMITRA